jgi:hypothetical protein
MAEQPQQTQENERHEKAAPVSPGIEARLKAQAKTHAHYAALTFRQGTSEQHQALVADYFADKLMAAVRLAQEAPPEELPPCCEGKPASYQCPCHCHRRLFNGR